MRATLKHPPHLAIVQSEPTAVEGPLRFWDKVTIVALRCPAHRASVDVWHAIEPGFGVRIGRPKQRTGLVTRSYLACYTEPGGRERRRADARVVCLRRRLPRRCTTSSTSAKGVARLVRGVYKYLPAKQRLERDPSTTLGTYSIYARGNTRAMWFITRAQLPLVSRMLTPGTQRTSARSPRVEFRRTGSIRRSMGCRCKRTARCAGRSFATLSRIAAFGPHVLRQHGPERASER